jgi:nitrogen fixation protein NifU and related proteins
MAKYPKYLLKHFQSPQNVGEILNPDGSGTACNAACGDIVQIFLRCEDSRISEVTFKSYGCGAAIAAASILTERLKGASVNDALKISEALCEELLAHLPDERVSCFKMVVNALTQAVEEYKRKQADSLTSAQPDEGRRVIGQRSP